MVAVEAAGVALRRSRICVDRTKSLKTRVRARNRFARIAQARRKALGPYLSITRNCLARNRVLVLAGVVAIARELVDCIAQLAHIDRLRDSTSAGKKAPLGKNSKQGVRAFSLAAQLPNPSRESACVYGESTSGVIVYKNIRCAQARDEINS